MRFSFDDLYADVVAERCESITSNMGYSSEEYDGETEYSLIGDPSDGIQLKLPKMSSNKKKEEDESSSGTESDLSIERMLDPRVTEMLENLKISFQTNSLALLNLKEGMHSKSLSVSNQQPLLIDHTRQKSNLITDEANPVIVLSQETMASEWESSVGAVENMNLALIRTIREQKHKEEKEMRERLEEEKRAFEEQLARKTTEDKRRKEQEEQRLKEEEQRKKRELELKQEQERLKKLQDAKLEQDKSKQGKERTDFKSIEQYYLKYKAMIQTIKTEIVEPVKKDTNLKKILTQHKRKINPKFGQLTNSIKQLHDIIDVLTGLIDETKPNELGYKWILNFIAKAIVSQAESEVRVKPESALPLAKLSLNLLARYPELKDLLLSRFIKKCPFVIGYTCRIDTVEGRTRMGWKRQNDNKWEDDTTYDERMGGMISLFAVITRLPLPAEYIQIQSHPFPIAWSWHILARIANTPSDLITNTHFIVLSCWWEAAAAQFLEAYRKQAIKLLQLLAMDLTLLLAERKYVGAARLRILHEEWHATNSIKEFPEMTA